MKRKVFLFFICCVLMPVLCFSQEAYKDIEKEIEKQLSENKEFQSFLKKTPEEQASIIERNIAAITANANADTVEKILDFVDTNKSVLVGEGKAAITFNDPECDVENMPFGAKVDWQRDYTPKTKTYSVIISVEKSNSVSDYPYATRFIFKDDDGKKPKINIFHKVVTTASDIPPVVDKRNYQEDLSTMLSIRYLPTHIEYVEDDFKICPELKFLDNDTGIGKGRMIYNIGGSVKLSGKYRRDLNKKQIWDLFKKGGLLLGGPGKWSEKKIQTLFNALVDLGFFPPRHSLKSVSWVDSIDLDEYYDKIDYVPPEEKKKLNPVGVYLNKVKKIIIDDDADEPFRSDKVAPEDSVKAIIIHEIVHALQYEKANSYLENKNYGVTDGDSWKEDSIALAEAAYGSALVEDFANSSNWEDQNEKIEPFGNKKESVLEGKDRWKARDDKKAVADFPTPYGSTDILEDMADTVAIYFCNPEWLKEKFPGRYGFCQRHFAKKRIDVSAQGQIEGELGYNMGYKYKDSYEIVISDMKFQETKYYDE